MTGILHPSVVAHSLLDQVDSFFIHLNPKVSGVVIPRHLYVEELVTLQIGKVMAKPIIGMRLTEYGWWGTLSFGEAPFQTLVPWHSVVAMSCLDNGPVVSWPKPVEMGALPESFPGREKEGDNFWCPRRQRIVDDCAKHQCHRTECMYEVRWRETDGLNPARRDAVVRDPVRDKTAKPEPIIERRRLEVIKGGKKT